MDISSENGFGIEGHQYTDPKLMKGVAGGYYSGGQWRHFVQYDPYGYTDDKCLHVGNTHNIPTNISHLSERHVKLYGGNVHKLEFLKKLVSDNEMTKIIYIDFSSIYSGEFKNFTDSSNIQRLLDNAREKMMMLRFYGFTLRIIVRDYEANPVIDEYLNSLGGIKIIKSIPDDVTLVERPLKDADVLSILKGDEVTSYTKVTYIGNNLTSTGFANGRLRPILMTTEDSFYMEKHVADYVSISKTVEGHHLTDLFTALLYAHKINPMSYLSKSRRMNFKNDIKSNKIHDLGYNILFADNSISVDGYLMKLETVFGIERDQIYTAINHVSIENNPKRSNDIYISTVLNYFIENFGSVKINRVYFMNIFKPTVLSDNDLMLLKSLDNIYFPELEWTFLINDLTANEIETNVLDVLREHKLYNIMSMLNVYNTEFTGNL